MTNWHVLLVHFPISLLVLYSLLEISRIQRLQDFLHHFHIKAFLVIAGTASAVAAGLSGAEIEDAFRSSQNIRAVLHLHSGAAQVTTAYFGLFALLYAVAWLGRENMLNRLPYADKILLHVEECLRSRWMIAVGIVGFALITLTGALGGIIAYGPDVDPIARFVYNLLGF